MAQILVTGLNPAWQKVLEFEALTPGKVNRASSCHEFGSGKGLNAAMALRRLGHEVSLLQVLGGANGQRLSDFCERSGIHSLDVRVEPETRVCSTLLDRRSAKVTELIEPFAVQTRERVTERLLELLPGSARWDALVIMGTAPAGVDPAIYGRIAHSVHARLVVVDIIREMDGDLLETANVIKINAEEFRQLENRGFDWRGDRLRWPIVLITDGPDPALLLENQAGTIRRTSFRLPPLARVYNPIGAGDTVTAYLAHQLLEGRPVQEACREALAAGSASCLTLLPGDYDPQVQRNLATTIDTTV
jgi:fructose-1-phosphate kinase PfkB-like protein